MTTTTETIEAHAARRAEAREHWRCEAHDIIGLGGCFTSHLAAGTLSPMLCIRDGVERPHPVERCTDDHRTPAERKAAALDALAGAYMLAPVLGDRVMIAQIYDSVRNREEAPDA